MRDSLSPADVRAAKAASQKAAQVKEAFMLGDSNWQQSCRDISAMPFVQSDRSFLP